jgi:hypothetical protein
MPEPPSSLPLAFQLRVVLRGVSPLIWRREPLPVRAANAMMLPPFFDLGTTTIEQN